MILFFFGNMANGEPRPESSFSAPGILADFTSPITTEARNPFFKGCLLTGALLIFEDQIIDPAQADTVEDKPLRSSAKYGDWAGQGIPNLLYASGALLVGYANDSTLAYRRAKHMALATGYSGLTAQMLKNIVREPRPNDHNDRASFPSGHTTTAFAFASVIGMDHGWQWGVPAYAMALFVGFSRMNDNKHYIHDVTSGATIGLGYGLGTYYNMVHRFETPGHLSVQNIYMTPNLEGGTSLSMIMSY